MPGHLITNNTLISFECLHAMQHNNRKHAGSCAYKLDPAKGAGGLRFLIGSAKENGLPKYMGTMDHGMCDHYTLSH